LQTPSSGEAISGDAHPESATGAPAQDAVETSPAAAEVAADSTEADDDELANDIGSDKAEDITPRPIDLGSVQEV
jgi:hypothetical protein